MRFLEILIPIALGIYILWPMFNQARPTAVNILPAFALLCLLTHLNVEGSRWQMALLYFLTPLMFILSVPAFTPGRIIPPVGLPVTLSALGVLLLATALPVLLPVPAVPKPTGPYQVGTTTFVLVDENRLELYSDRDEPRKFMIQVWYPAQAGPESRRAAWMDNASQIAPAISEYLNLPGFFLDHLALAKSDSWQDAPSDPSGGPYPLLVFSHGWNGFRAQNTYQVQELASHGYVVVSLEHTYGSVLTVFPDGQVAPNNPNALPDAEGMGIEEYEIIARLLVNQWSGDIDFAVNYMKTLNEQDPAGRFTNLVDISQVGALGHSTGGGAAIEYCGRYADCKAAFLMDPFLRPVSREVLETGLQQPSFTFFSQAWADDTASRNNELFATFAPGLAAPSPVVTILGTRHYDFSDLPALSPLAPYMGLKGPINGERVQRLINDYTLAFFNQAFKAEESSLLNGPSEMYPELRWER